MLYLKSKYCSLVQLSEKMWRDGFSAHATSGSALAKQTYDFGS